MGFFGDLFDKDKKEDKKYQKLEKTLTNMYVQAMERGAVIEQLKDLGTPEAVRILLARYRENTPNTTVDLEEKERIAEVLVMLGKVPDSDTVEIIKTHLRKTDGRINWPMRILSDLLEFDDFAAFVAELLDNCHTDYEQNPEKKQALILRTSEFQHDLTAKALPRFLGDMNETIRFLTVESILSQKDPSLHLDPICEQLAEEESLRIVKKIAEAFNANHNWLVPEPLRESVGEALPDEYGVHDKGHIYKRR